MKHLQAAETVFSSVQWLFFIFANTVVVPISVGMAFDLGSHEIAVIVRSSLIFTGIACMLQGLIGHKYPLMEGHSGVMWGVVLNLCAAAPSLGMSLTSIGGGIATGMLLSGAVVLLMGALRLLPLIQRIFTPMVMSVYLFLLTFQLILIFFKGMLTVTEEGRLVLPMSLFSIGIVILVSILKVKGTAVLSNFSILIGMVTGWIGYLVLFPSESAGSVAGGGSFFLLFPFGAPNLNAGIVFVTFLACLMNLSNTLASVQAASKLYDESPSEKRVNSSYLLSGMYSIVAAISGLVSYAPFASSIGFLESTRILKMKPFLIGGALMSLLGIIPFLGGILATLPITIGNAVLFTAYLQLFGTSLKSLNGTEFNSVTIYRLAFPVLIGISIMNLDPRLFTALPVFVQPIVSNGFIVGVLVSIVLEKAVNWEKEDQVKTKSA
ncbi:uracil/xanthine transporter [Rossellomorea aquimaris]|uniref:uracil/xanthine transporter n=1 Tax=Rossellomorea aquimaris TaxID=189382 RepID=UPI001CD32FC5|nr:uracil/xanthine transporter [Rossellomorea aquimaris]MCA1054986.1 uracil/xanthine transporter [Rossellomorea aquimaris]